MSCPDHRPQISRLVDDELGLEERWRLERHLAGCADCRAELADLHRLGGLLRANDAPAPTAGADFRAATLAAAHGVMARPTTRSRARSRWIWGLPLAACFAVVAAGTWPSAAPPRPVADGSGGAIPEPARVAPITPLEQYQRALAQLTDADLLGHFKLAVWAEDHGLTTPAQERLEHVLTLDSHHAPARERLGYVRYDGGWLRRADATARGLVAVDGEWMTREHADRLARGLRCHEGEWLTPEEILTRKGFVLSDGIWLTPGEAAERARQEHRAEAEVTVRGLHASLAPEAIQRLEGVMIGEPRQYAHLAIFPLFAQACVEPAIVSLAEAAGRGDLRVEDMGNVNVTNRGTQAVYVPGGQILAGGHQDRINLRSLVIAPQETRVLDARCCERGRSSGASREFNGFARWAPTAVRHLTVQGEQGRIWDQIDRFLGQTHAVSGTSALRATYETEHFTRLWDGYEGALADVPAKSGNHCIGVVAARDGRVVSIDLFGGHGLLAGVYPALLASLVVDALAEDERSESAPPPRGYVRSCVERLALARYRPVPIDAQGRPDPRQQLHALDANFGAQEHLAGQAVVYDGRTVHVSVYAQKHD